MDSRELDIKALKKLVKEAFPELLGYHLPVRARVVKVHEEGGQIEEMARRYSVDVQPLKPDGSDDEVSPVIPDVEIPVLWAGPDRGVYCLPEIGAIVRVMWDYGDPSAPYISQVLGMGYNCPEHPLGQLIIQHSPGCFVKLGTEKDVTIQREDGVRIRIHEDNKIVIETPEEVTVKSGTEAFVTAPRVVLAEGDHPIAFGDVVKQIFDGHVHPTPAGTSGPPSPSMSGHQSSKVFSG